MSCSDYDLEIRQGETFSRVIRWAGPPYVYKAITGITKAAPAVVTATAHGLVTGQSAAIVSVVGMTEINAEHDPPRNSEYHKVTVLTANTVEINDINSTGFTTYASGGYLQYLTPVSLVGYTARMSIKDKIGGTEYVSLTTANGRIVLDTANSTITFTLTAAETAAFTWRRGVYDLELVSAGSVVSTLLHGDVTVTQEVTT